MPPGAFFTTIDTKGNVTNNIASANGFANSVVSAERSRKRLLLIHQ